MLTVNTASLTTQLPLFDCPAMIRFPSAASARTRYGEVAEQIAIAALRAKHIPINGNYDVCFDAQKGERFFEIKSVRSGGECPIYNCRIQKDQDSGKELYYAFVLHRAMGAKDSIQLWNMMSRTVKEIIIAPLSVVAGLHSLGKQVQTCTSKADRKNGYSRDGYRDGYRRVSMSALKSLPERARGRRFALKGHRFNIKMTEVGAA